MTTWKVENRLSNVIVYAYTSDIPVEWPGMEFSIYNHIKEVEIEKPIAKRRLTKLEFIGRIGEPVFIALLGMAQVSVEIAAWIELVRMATPEQDGTSIDLDDPRTVSGLQALEAVLISNSIVSEGWASGVLI